MKTYNMYWQQNFDERQIKEIEFCRIYAKDFGHGALGHNLMLIVAKMAKLLDDNESVVPDTVVETHNATQPDIVYAIGSDKPIAATSLDSELARCSKCGQIFYMRAQFKLYQVESRGQNIL